jgi:hypothetical protein
MRGRPVILLSLAANLVLAAGWFLSAREQAWRAGKMSHHELASPAQVKTNVVIRRQFFSWQEIETDDYPTYITNLRDIGCPEQTIRDIIIAEVNDLYAKKLATEIVTPEQQWWRAEPDTNIVRVASEKGRALEQERRELLTRLLARRRRAWNFAGRSERFRARNRGTLARPHRGLHRSAAQGGQAG